MKEGPLGGKEETYRPPALTFIPFTAFIASSVARAAVGCLLC